MSEHQKMLSDLLDLVNQERIKAFKEIKKLRKELRKKNAEIQQLKKTQSLECSRGNGQPWRRKYGDGN